MPLSKIFTALGRFGPNAKPRISPRLLPFSQQLQFAMAFNSSVEAHESRKAVAGLMGLAMREGFLSATTDHFDLTPGVEGRSPLAPGRDGIPVPAPDVILLGSAPGIVIGVEVEARSLLNAYPRATQCDVAKLRDNLYIDTVSATYARAIKGSDYDASSSWRQRDIADLLISYEQKIIDFTISRGAQLLTLYPENLHELHELWARLRGESR